MVIDACAGGSQSNALDALRNGDIAAVAAVSFGRSTPICRAQAECAGSNRECRRVSRSQSCQRDLAPAIRRLNFCDESPAGLELRGQIN